MTDGGDPALSASTDVTITVNDVNEAPTVAEGKMLGDQTQMAGDSLEWTVDLTGLFEDQDDDDRNLVYSLDDDSLNGVLGADNKPIELELTVTRVIDGEGNLKIEGVITSTKAIAAGQRPGSFDVTVVATDDDDDTPMSGEASFKVHVDDRNDEITGIKLYDLNEDGTAGDENILYVVDVDENEDTEVNLGRITTQDIDSPDHPHGDHTVTVDDKRFETKSDGEGGWWLILKAGNALDREEEKAITLTITAKDGAAPASSFDQVVTVDINDVNDAPTGRENMGNWWVTVDEDLDAEDVTAGQWLSFQLESESEDEDENDFYPAFMDEDSGKNGELTYTLDPDSTPSWLMIDKATGVIQNKKGMLPTDSGTQMITVKATDGGGAEAMINFHLTWAISGADNEDNDEPTLRITRENEINENTAEGVLVATFTVNDDDSGLTGHPFAPGKPTITGAVNADDSSDSTAYAGAFTLKQNGNVWEVRTTKAAAALLDYESVDEITITVQVSDGVIADPVTEEIDVDINDVNEKPVVLEDYSGPGSEAVTVEQSETATQYLWIKAHELWGDMDDRQDAGDMNFDASSNVPWITIVYKGAWEDLEDGPDGDSRTADDNVAWGTIRGVTASDAGTEPDDSDDYVIVVEIDRTAASNKQADVAKGGEITLTARDEGGATGEHTVKVSVTDENLDIGADAVTISGNEREGMTLTATFDEEKDPDLVGSPEAYLVIYTWSATENEDGTGGTVRKVGASNTYTMTQADVGMYISVDVTYRELEVSGDETDFTATPQSAGSAVTTDDEVLNTPDKGDVKFNVYVNSDQDGLTAEVLIIDEDGIDTTADSDPDDDAGTPPVYTWQYSVNGVSGWKPATDTDTSDTDLTLADGDGGWYRLVVTYTDQQNVAERHVSDSVQVGELSAPETDPELSATSGTVVGSTLRVDNPGSKVEWQQQHGTVGNTYWSTIATGNTLAITSDHEGAVLRAVVSHSGDDGLEATTVLAVNGGSAIAALPNTAPTAVKETHYIDQDMDKDATVTEARGTIDVASLFEDLDGDKLTFTVTAGPGSDLVTAGANNAAIWMSANDQGLMSFDASTGELVYVTDEKSGHDGNDNDGSDGGSNIVTVTVQASDGTAQDTATVGVRLNVAPTDVEEVGATLTVLENDQTAGTLVTLDVQDENSPMHDYGKYTWAIKEDDDRFTITRNEADNSQAVLAVKAGQEFETAGTDGMITLTLVATEVGNTDNKVEHMVTITVTNDADDDPDAPDAAPDGNTVPGLKDNEASDTDDKADGTDGDGSTTPDDTDGGWYEPPADAGMMVIDNDLLDSFVLAIDDIDAA